MLIGALKKLKSHLFIKIFLVFLLALFITIVSLVVAHGFFFHPTRFSVTIRNVVNHAGYLIKDLGVPPPK